MLRVASWWMVAAMTLAAPASTSADTSPHRLELVCTGVEPTREGARTLDRTYSQRISIDLDAGRFCLDECAEWFPVAAISETKIILRDALEGARHADRIIVHREDGAYRLESSFGATLRQRAGPCREREQ